MSGRALAMVLVLALSAALLATWPLRLALGTGFQLAELGVSAADVSGSVWSGRLRSVEWRGQPLGDVAIALVPLALLTGVPALHLGTPGFSADLLGGRRDGVDNANGELQFALQAPWQGVAVRLSLANASLLFAEGRCRHAGGIVQVEVIGIGQPVRLSGPVRCNADGGSVALASAPGTGLPRVKANLAIDGAGRYRLDSLVQPGDGVSILALRSAGFEPTQAGLARTDSGRLY